MVPPRLHLPKHIAKQRVLATRVFFRANGALFGIYNVPESISSLQFPDYEHVYDVRPTGDGGAPHEINVIDFIRMNIKLQGHGINGVIVCFVEKPALKPQGVIQ